MHALFDVLPRTEIIAKDEKISPFEQLWVVMLSTYLTNY